MGLFFRLEKVFLASTRTRLPSFPGLLLRSGFLFSTPAIPFTSFLLPPATFLPSFPLPEGSILSPFFPGRRFGLYGRQSLFFAFFPSELKPFFL